jgi:hypothetical protein
MAYGKWKTIFEALLKKNGATVDDVNASIEDLFREFREPADAVDAVIDDYFRRQES